MRVQRSRVLASPAIGDGRSSASGKLIVGTDNRIRWRACTLTIEQRGIRHHFTLFALPFCVVAVDDDDVAMLWVGVGARGLVTPLPSHLDLMWQTHTQDAEGCTLILHTVRRCPFLSEERIYQEER